MIIRSLTAAEERKVLENKGLVHHILKSYQFNPNDYDDLAQIGMIGLIKAVVTFDENRKITFATYASKVIHNELRMYFRRNKKTLQNTSINTVLNQDFNGEEMTLEDILFDERTTGFEENIEKTQMVNYCITLILNCFSNRDAMILLYATANVNQRKIGEKLGISQSYVSRKIERLRNMLKEYMEQEEELTENWISVKTNGNYFEISVPMNWLAYGQAHHDICLRITKIRKPSGAKVTFEDEKVNISFPKEEEYLAFVADVLYEMAYFHKVNESLKVESTVNEDDSNVQKEMSMDSASVKVIKQETEHEVAIDSKVTEECKQNTKKTSQAEAIREYMSALKKFTLKQIKEKFSEVKLSAIMYAIRTAEKEGLIERTSRGNYRGLKIS